ncbi:MAG: hypothetical protein BWY77_01558 [bacterium ADurb.Bin431]|nr:MAG: hypothetical protein BWY77_01558 [bacterium ADurb.Bin431]
MRLLHPRTCPRPHRLAAERAGLERGRGPSQHRRQHLPLHRLSRHPPRSSPHHRRPACRRGGHARGNPHRGRISAGLVQGGAGAAGSPQPIPSHRHHRPARRGRRRHRPLRAKARAARIGPGGAAQRAARSARDRNSGQLVPGRRRRHRRGTAPCVRTPRFPSRSARFSPAGLIDPDPQSSHRRRQSRQRLTHRGSHHSPPCSRGRGRSSRRRRPPHPPLASLLSRL